MIRQPALKAHLRAGTVQGEGVILLSEEHSWTLHGPLFERVLPLLDGTRTSDQIATELAPARPAEVFYVLEFLEKRGHLSDHALAPEGGDPAYWAGLGLDPAAAWKALRAARVRIRGAGPVDTTPLLRALEEAGLDLASGEPTLEIVVTDDYLRADLEPWAGAAREAGRSWMAFRPFGREFWIGPLFPGAAAPDSPCFTCLRHRLRRNQQVQEFLRNRNGWRDPQPTAVAALPAAVGAACRVAAVELAKFLAGAPHNLEDRLLSMDTRTWTSRTHRLVRYPACPACGGPGPEPPGPVRLEHRPAAVAEGSGHRATAPAATLEAYDHLVSPILGIVSMVEPSPWAEAALPVCIGGSNGAMPLDSLASFKACLRQRSAGKGPSLIQARASALAETLERYAAEYTGGEYRILASYRELGDAAIHPNAVMGFSEQQYRARADWNARGSRFNGVPEPLDPDQRIPWSPVWSLTAQRQKLLPTQCL
jgi:ribosomal protein S12 methylthiotransferase accessory factor